MEVKISLSLSDIGPSMDFVEEATFKNARAFFFDNQTGQQMFLWSGLEWFVAQGLRVTGLAPYYIRGPLPPQARLGKVNARRTFFWWPCIAGVENLGANSHPRPCKN